jgi:hypothetical protein
VKRRPDTTARIIHKTERLRIERQVILKRWDPGRG